MSASPSLDDPAALDLNAGGGQERDGTAVEADPASDPGGGEKGGGESEVGFGDPGDGDSVQKPEIDVGEKGDVAGSEEVSGTVVPEGSEAGESSNGTGIGFLAEKVAAFEEKGRGEAANEVKELDLVGGCFQATEVGKIGSRGQEMGDGCSGDQGLGADALETGNLVGIAVEEAKDEGLQTVADLGGDQEVVVEIRCGTKTVKEDESRPEKKASEMSDLRNQLVDGKAQVLGPKGLELEDRLGSKQKSEINAVDGEYVVEHGKGTEVMKEQIMNQNSDCEVRGGDLVDEHLRAPEGDMGSVAFKAQNSLGGDEMLAANVDGAGFGVGTVKTQDPVAFGKVEADSLKGVADLGLMQGGVAVFSNKIELTKEGVSCPEKDKSVVGEVMDLEFAQGALGPKALETENVLDGDQELEAGVLKVGCLMGAAKTQAAVDLGGEEAERLKSMPNLELTPHKVPETSGTDLTVQGVSCPLRNQSMVTEKGGHGLADAHLQASEGDNSQNQSVVVESTAGTKDMDEGLPLDGNQDTKAWATGCSTEGLEGSMVSSDQDRDHEASVSQMSFVDTNQKDQEVGNAICGEETKEVDFMPVNDAIIKKADYVIKDPDLADPGVELNKPDSNHDNDEPVDGEQIVTAESKAGFSNNVVHAEALSADRHPADQNAEDKLDIIPADGGLILDVMVMESESKGTQLVDENTRDREDTTTANSCSDFESQFSGTGPLGEKLIDRRDSVLKDSKVAVATGLPIASELSEIQTIVSQQKEIPGKNQETEPQSICLLVDRSDDAIVHEAESSPGICQNMDMEPEVLKDEISLPESCHEKGDLAQDSEADKKSNVLVDSVVNIVIDPDGAAEQNVQVDEQEHSKIADKQCVKRVSLRPGTCNAENDQHASYFLPLQDKDTFSISDLVWGKVKSHPWWPGQIFNPSDASDLAMKYQKKDNFLVAYFGDKTFAWCEETQLKPFETYFSQMEKQSSSDAFVNAVNDTLYEVSRRTELGMTCFCFPEQAYANIKHQTVENAGIREGISNSVFDRSLVVDYFQPDRLLGYIEALAQLPTGGANRLELVIAQAQLKAFYRSKGYPELPVFQIGGGLMENDADVSPFDSKLVGEDTIEHSTPTSMELNLGKRKRGRGRPSNKEKQMLEDAKKQMLEDAKKQMNLSDLMDENILSPLANGEKIGSAVKFDGDSTSLSSEKKRKVIDLDSDYSVKSKKKHLDSLGDLFTKPPSPTPSSSFKVGECIRRVASQLKGSSSIVRCHGETFQRSISNAEHRRFDVVDPETSTHTTVENQRMKISISEDHSSPDEMLSQLCLAARDPMKGYSFLSMIVSFFTDFRNFCVSSSSKEKKHIQKIGGKRGRKRTVSSQSPSSDMSTADHMQDSYWSDMIYHNSSANDLKRKGDAHMRSQRKRRKSGGQTSVSLSCDRMLGPARHLEVGTISPRMKQASPTERSIISLEEKIVNECTPTALILIFNSSSSLPSETDLIRIFSRYGPLKEAETEVQRKTNHVKVVFKKRADAEIAFSSAGKYSIFGPALLSYRLRYLPATPNASPNTAPQGENDAESTEGGQLEVPGDVSPNTMSQGKSDSVPFEGCNSEVPGDASPNTIPQDKNDPVPIEGGDSEIPGSTAANITPQNQTDAGHVEGGYLEVPGGTSANATQEDKNDEVPPEYQNLEVPDDAYPNTTQEKNDAAPIKDGSLEASGNTSPNTTLQDENDAAAIEDCSLDVPGNTSPSTTPQDKNDAAAIKDGSLDVPGNTSPSATPQEKNDAAAIKNGGFNVPGNTSPSTTPQDKNDAAVIEDGSLDVPVNTSPSTTPQDKNDAAPIEDGSLEVPGNAYPNTTTQDKNAVLSEGGNLEVPAKAEIGVVSDTMQVEVVDKGSVVPVDNQSG